MQNKEIFMEDVTSWKEFGKHIRSKGCELIKRLDDFPNSILVTGCQRSGTSMTSEIINQSDELVDYSYGRELSLDAAMILSGTREHTPQGRYCFQTTWLNQCYPEYFKFKNGHKYIWVLRNPYSVIRSMTGNWPIGALDELFVHCGLPMLTGKDKRAYNFWSNDLVTEIQELYFGYKGKGAKYLMRDRISKDRLMTIDFGEKFVYRGIDKLHRACFSYYGKVAQIFEMRERLSSDELIIVEYNGLVKNKEDLLPVLFDFIDLEYKPEFADIIHSNSLKKSESLTDYERDTIKTICEPIYNKALELVDLGK